MVFYYIYIYEGLERQRDGGNGLTMSNNEKTWNLILLQSASNVTFTSSDSLSQMYFASIRTTYTITHIYCMFIKLLQLEHCFVGFFPVHFEVYIVSVDAVYHSFMSFGLLFFLHFFLYASSLPNQ